MGSSTRKIGVDRDIRESELGADFNVAFTDSTDPLQVISSQFADTEDYEYAFVLNNSSRIAMKQLQGYEKVDGNSLHERSDIFCRNAADGIVTGDLVYMRRPRKWRTAVDKQHRNKNLSLLSNLLSQNNVQESRESIKNIEAPFSE